VFPFGETLHYTDIRPNAPVDQIAREVRAFLEQRGFAAVQAEPAAPTVEDTFMARMGAPEGQGARA
jgi:hypothetical protein